MRRFALFAVVLTMVGAAAAGCAVAPKGTDSNLVDDWPMLATAKVPEPAEGSCWTTDRSTLDAIIQAPGKLVGTPCDFEHALETIKVGHFTGNVADGGSAPSRDALADAYKECDAAAGAFLGGEWQAGRVHLLVVVPTNAQWAGGGRFFRCDAGALRTEAGTIEARKTTLKDSLKDGGELRLGCGNQVGVDDKGGWDDITPSACTAPHDTEFVGTVTSPSPAYPKEDKALGAAFDAACKAKLLSYAKMSQKHWDQLLALNYGYWMVADPDEWTSGNHAARCYAMIDKKKISRSLKGAGDISI